MVASNISASLIQNQIPFVVDATNFSGFGERYQGKVRDNYTSGDRRIIVTTDRLSCFDRVVTTVPFKGQLLNELASHWFEQTKDIVPNHILDIPHPNVMVVKNCKVLPVEVVVRGYLAGSAWRDYSAGRPVSGVKLPLGLRESARLAQPIITPSTKAEQGSHDLPISESEILERKLVDSRVWANVREAALSLFAFGQREAISRGLILVDTKYEFGLDGDSIVLVDEIHTLDCARFWVAATYEERVTRGEQPEMLDKQPIRRWLLERGFSGDGVIPSFSEEHRVQIAQHYISSYERIAGKPFTPTTGNTIAAIEKAIQPWKVN